MGLFVMGFIVGQIVAVFALALVGANGRAEARLEPGQQEQFDRWEYELTWDDD